MLASQRSKFLPYFEPYFQLFLTPASYAKTSLRTMSSTSQLESLGNQYIVPTYTKDGVRSKKDLVLSHGSGTVVFDTNGRSYLDFASGIAVSILGHANPEIQSAVSDQLGKISHSSNLYNCEPQLHVAEKLIKLSPGMSKVFFTNSGTEANEGALKFCQIYNNLFHSSSKKKILSFENSFHGRSLGSLSLTYKPKIREPFKDLLNQNVHFLPFNDIAAFSKAITPDTLAVFLEPVQGEGGVNPVDKDFLAVVRTLCDKNNTLLVFDEVQIGLGRSGNNKIWSYENYGITPDILTCAKPLAGGLPMGAILLSEKYMKQINTLKNSESIFLGLHGSTFAGNPVVARAAEVVLNKLGEKAFLAQVAQTGELLTKGLIEIGNKYPMVIRKVTRPIFDKALYCGIHVKASSGFGVDKIIDKCIDKGLLIISAGDKNEAIRICPPLNVSSAEINRAVQIIDSAFAEVIAESEKSSMTLNFVQSVEEFKTKADFEAFLKKNAVLPNGFDISATTIEFLPNELGKENTKKYKMNLSLVKLDKATENYGAVFTKNKFPGAPIKVGKEIVSSKSPIGALIVNNRISNVHPRNGGVEDAKQICEAIKKELKFDSNTQVVPSSTGIIGWQLPVKEIVASVPTLTKSLTSVSGNKKVDKSELGFDFAKRIMTTDSYPKARTCEILSESGEYLGRITGFAKGAGMIEPNMATMLVFIFTDINTSGFKNSLQELLTTAVNLNGSFNKISIDSDQSTSDTVLLLSSNSQLSQNAKNLSIDLNIKQTEELEKSFAKALGTISKELSEEIVRNGEGVTHVLKVRVSNCKSQKLANEIGKKIINSPLVKTAVAGNDPNVGRIIASIGNYFSDIELDVKSLHKKLRIKVGEFVVFENGEFTLDGAKEKKLIEYFKKAEHSLEDKFPKHFRSVEIEVDFCEGSYDSEVIGADLTEGYVKENAGYRS